MRQIVAIGPGVHVVLSLGRRLSPERSVIDVVDLLSNPISANAQPRREPRCKRFALEDSTEGSFDCDPLAICEPAIDVPVEDAVIARSEQSVERSTVSFTSSNGHARCRILEPEIIGKEVGEPRNCFSRRHDRHRFVALVEIGCHAQRRNSIRLAVR
jgi:hypothetical protein